MESWRRRRRPLSWWLVLALLFAQLATAAYACPRERGPVDDTMAPAAMALMPGCDGNMPDGLDPDQPLLCKAHCQADPAAGQPPAAQADVPVAADLPVALLPAAVDTLAAAVPVALRALARNAGPPAGTPPIYLSLLVLRR